METKNENAEQKDILTVSYVKKNYAYENPISLKSFAELENPVIDSEGYIREKNEPDITKGVYSRQPVTITNSSDIKKVQEDYRTLENRVYDMERMFFQMKSRMDEQDKKIEEQDKKISKLEKTVEIQAEHIKNLLGIIDDKNFQIKEKDKQIKEKNERIEKLENRVEELENKEKEEESAKEVREVENNMQEIALGWKKPDKLPVEAKWRERNALLGFKHTFFESEYPREKQENDIRRYAYEGNTNRLKTLLEKDKTLVNGRGMPDSAGSFIKSWKDKTPLMLAAENGNKECVKLLIDNGAHLNYLDREKSTALDYAETNNHQKVSVFLKKHGAENGRYLKNIFEPKNDTNIKLR